MKTDTVAIIDLLAGCVVLFALASAVPTHANAETVREQMLVVSESSRNTAFSAFLTRHGQTCVVNQSVFTAKARLSRDNGDVWSVKCVEGRVFAIFISDDSKSTSWFMPCEVLHHRSNLRCFEAPPPQIAFK